MITLVCVCAHNDLIDGAHLHDVLELFIHVSQSELAYREDIK